MPAVRVRVSMGAMGSEGANSAELARDADDATAIESCAADLGAAKLARLRDGSWVTVRATGARDEPALLVFLSELCLEARRMRFFTGAADIEYAAHLGAASGPDRLGLIVHDEGGRTVGHATYVKLDDERAEVAVEVADHLHGRGLGTFLIERLAQGAQSRGIVTFVAEVLPENRAMLDVFRDGFDAHVRFHDGTDTAEFPTAAWRVARDRFEQAPASAPAAAAV
jgi:GNAT superfamily N-acetyltransferase